MMASVLREENIMKALFFTTALAALAFGGPAAAQDEDAQQSAIDALKKDKEEAQLEYDLEKIKLDKLKLITDALPSFDGKAEADAATGKFEASILAVGAMGALTDQIANRFSGKTVLFLAGDETFGFGQPFALNGEMKALYEENRRVCGSPCEVRPDGAQAESFAGILTAVSAVAGLLRSDVKLTTLAPSGTSDAKFATALAASLNGNGGTGRTLGGNPGTKLNTNKLETLNTENLWSEPVLIGKKYAWLVQADLSAKGQIRELENGTKAEQKRNKKKIESLKAWRKQFSDFSTRVLKVQADKATIMGQAIMAEQIEDGLNHVVRAYIEAGGSTKKSTNLGTFFGGDPFRVTGGIHAHVVSYDVSDSTGARIDGWGQYACSSGHLRFKEVRGAKFTFAPLKHQRGNSPVCWTVKEMVLSSDEESSN